MNNKFYNACSLELYYIITSIANFSTDFFRFVIFPANLTDYNRCTAAGCGVLEEINVTEKLHSHVVVTFQRGVFHPCLSCWYGLGIHDSF